MHRKVWREKVKTEKDAKEVGSTSRAKKEEEEDGGEKRDEMRKQSGGRRMPRQVWREKTKKEKDAKDMGNTSRDMMLSQIGESWDLPQDITSDILLRLPVKSVMRCRCVCRAWRTLLHNPHFIDMHLTRSSQVKNKNPSLLLTTLNLSRDNDKSDPRVPVLKMDYNVHLVEHMLELGIIDQPTLPLQVLQHGLGVDASCNGLLCLSSIFCNNDMMMLIFNPLTRETIELPRSNIPFKINNGICGLGYHPTTKEYKVLWFAFVHPSKDSYKVMAQVYTLGSSSSWRSKGEVPFAISYRPFNVLVNGSLHYLAYYPTDSENVVIISFDIGDEKFRVLPVPPQSRLVDKWQYKQVQELGGFLSLVDFSSRDRVDIWVMKHYGVEESWIKQFMVPIPELVDSVSLLWHFEGGQILLHYNKANFISYDPNNNEIKHIAVQVPETTITHSLVHMGSLLSPRLAV